MEALAADSESDEYNKQSDEESETLQRQWLQLCSNYNNNNNHHHHHHTMDE
jgi:hypothetical protein